MENTKKCEKCFSDIPFKATRCPKCHADLRSWVRRHPILTFIIFGFLSAIILSSSNERDYNLEKNTSIYSKEDTATCSSFVTFNDLLSENLISDDKMLLAGVTELERLSKGSSLEALFFSLKQSVSSGDNAKMHSIYGEIGEKCLKILM
jgi:hypothetical protein